MKKTKSSKWIAARSPRRSRCRNGEKAAPTYAALDLGTNNCRLLVARPEGQEFRVVDAFSRIVRLGEGLGARGELSNKAIDRTIAALQICARKISRHGVSAARCVATEACRKAANCGHFLARAHDETGIELEIIDPNEEARLALAGCLPLLEPADGHALVFDIGGGSTELIWLTEDAGSNGSVDNRIASVSMPFGVVSLSERFGGRDLDPADYDDMVARIGEELKPFATRHNIRAHAEAENAQMLGTSGTVTTLAAMHQQLKRYDRSKVDGSYLTFDEIAAVRNRLRRMSYEDRVALSCIGRGRADLVLAGSAILDAICAIWPVGRIRVADRGLREGILMGLMAHTAPGPAHAPA